MEKFWIGVFIIAGTAFFTVSIVGFGALMERFFHKRKMSS